MDKITYAFPKIKGMDPSYYIDAYNLLLECSNAHTPREFTITLIEMVRRMCPYDQAIAFFFDRYHKIADYYSVGTKEGWLESYLNYFLKYINSDFVITSPRREDSRNTSDRIIDWDDIPSSYFKKEYIDLVNLKHTWSFTFFDMNGIPRVTICLDRRHKEPFSEEQQKAILLALPILNNMHRNFYYKDRQNVDTQSLWKDYNLTTREKEIADMLCQGLNAARISSLLYISESTTYKHIAHIYKKVGVSSHQELIARMLSWRSLT